MRRVVPSLEVHLDRLTLERLRETERDLQIELDDVAHEIITREARVVDIMRQLRETRATIARLLRDLPVGAQA